jgi:recombination protein RecR
MFPNCIQNLINEFSKLPGIGPKAAERIVFYLLEKPKKEVKTFIQAMIEVKTKTKICKQCFNVSEDELCRICSDLKRDKTIICVVENALDIIPLEKTGQFKGLYHILDGKIEPSKGITPEKLHIKELMSRLKKEKIKEVIIATNPTTEGETTALYLVRLLKPLDIKITRIGRGLPTGASLEYADETTLSSALIGRREY